LIDATPIGINVRSTVATYANVHDELRKIYGKTKAAKQYGYEGWNRETIRQYLKVQEAGREDLLDLIEDGSITVFRAYKTAIAETNKSRNRKTNKIAALKKSVNAVLKESETRKYSEAERDTVRQLIGMLNEILENQEG